jgi:hypothetical protein
VQIEKGRFGDVPLDGLRWGILGWWPGAIHHGKGTLQAVVDARADNRQRDALEAVAHGKDTEPGTLVWNVFASMVTKFLPTVVAPIDLHIDVEQRLASVSVTDVVEGTIGPILNQVTGKPSRARLTLPNGFEFTEAEFASGFGKATGAIKLNFENTHAHLAHVHWSTHGVVR